MKKIMRIDFFGCGDLIFVDVSTTELLNKAYEWIFKNWHEIRYIKEDIKESEKDDTVYMKDCSFCDKTGKVQIKNREIVCPECKGTQLDETNKKEWDNFVKVYNKAVNGDIQSIKKILNGSFSFCSLDPCWEIFTVEQLK